VAGFKKFEEILTWRKTRKSAERVYEITTDDKFPKDFGLRNQLRRSSVSVMANIAEGPSRNSDKEFPNFLNIAHVSVADTQSHLYVAVDFNVSERNRFQGNL
jgi:four helix bundle protein